MKYFILISVLVFSAFSNTRDLVTNVNPIWNLDEFKDISLKVDYMPKSEVELIQLHLENVINVLENNAPSGLTQTQFNNRSYFIEVLKHYAERAKFPINNKYKERTSIFVDDYGTHCAVGYLIKTDKQYEMIKSVVESNNLIKILDIESDDFNKWQINSGFTKNELALIQPGYHEPDHTTFIPFDNNGKINDFEPFIDLEQNKTTKMAIGGSFLLIDGVNTQNVIVKEGDSFISLGDGLATEVYDLEWKDENTLFACGNDIMPTGFKHDIAFYNPKQDMWQGIGVGTDGIVEEIKILDNKVFARGEFSNVNGIISNNFFIYDLDNLQNPLITFDDYFQQGVKSIKNGLIDAECQELLVLTNDGNVKIFNNGTNSFDDFEHQEEKIVEDIFRYSIYDYMFLNSDSSFSFYNCDNNRIEPRESGLSNQNYLKIYDVYSFNKYHLVHFTKGWNDEYILNSVVNGIGYYLYYELESEETPVIGFESENDFYVFQDNTEIETKLYFVQKGVTSVEELESGFKFMVSENNVTINNSNKVQYDLRCVDGIGRTVFSENSINVAQKTISLDQQGLYIINLSSGTESVTKKIIINR